MRALLAAIALLLVPLSASARFHLWDITEVYSNADGSVQFIELAVNADLEDLLGGKTLASGTTNFTFPSNIPTTSTANHHLLIATPAFASQPGAVTPDYTFAAANFMSTAADTINFAAVDTFAFTAGQLPTNGVDSLNEPFGSNVRTTATNSPTNFAGQVGQLPEPSGWLGLLAGSGFLVGLARRRS
jgi:hypothetical protein